MRKTMPSDVHKTLRDEVTVFVRDDVPRQLILDMDAERVTYPREFIEAAARRRLLGLRFPKEYGGRGLGWAEEVVALEEVGVLGMSLERLLRDARLAMIWTGTNEIMNLVIQHEYYRELGIPSPGRNVEADAPQADQEEEKIYE